MSPFRAPFGSGGTCILRQRLLEVSEDLGGRAWILDDVARKIVDAHLAESGGASQQLEGLMGPHSKTLGEHPFGLFDDDPSPEGALELRALLE
jgi:hypothetical protein